MAKVMIMDGGMGHLLKQKGIEITGQVGSMRRFLGVAVANHEQPDMVKQAHLDFIDAGAEIIITNNYACVPKCLEHNQDGDFDLQRDGISGMVAAAGKCARAACDARPGKKVLVAGSMPPLADSYRPDKVGPFEENLSHYKTIAAAIAPYADVLVCETMSTADEARAALTGAATTGLPVWVSWTLDENNPVLRSGESLEEAYEKLASVENAKLEAILCNCTSPEITSVALPILRKLAPHLQIGAYANGFCTAADGVGEYRDLSPTEYYEFACQWIESGATILGGCCGIFPCHIAHLRDCRESVERTSGSGSSKL